MTISTLTTAVYPQQYQRLKSAEQENNTNDMRQLFAAVPNTSRGEAPEQPLSKTEEVTTQQQAFLTQLMHQMLANRIGLDKQKFDEITQKIAETQTERDELAKQPVSQQRDKKIEQLDAKLKMLNEALERLVKQASDNMGRNEREKSQTNKQLQQYQRV